MQIAILRRYRMFNCSPDADARAQACVGPGLATPLPSCCTLFAGTLVVIALLRNSCNLLLIVSTGGCNRSNRFHSHTTRDSHAAGDKTILLEETDTAIDATAANDTAAATTTSFTVPDFSIVISNPSPQHLSEEEGAQQSTRNRVSHLVV